MVVVLVLAEEEDPGPGHLVEEVDLLGHVFDVLHDEVHRDAVVPVPGDHDVGVRDRRRDEVSEGILHELVVLLQHPYDGPSPLGHVSLDPPAEADVV